MPRETKPARTARAQAIIARLKAAYPDAHCALEHGTPLELLIATILSAQCTDKRVNMVTPALFKKYKTAEDYAKADTAELEEEIKTTGFFRNKSRNIKACCAGIIERHGGRVPRTMEELVALDGVGRKTANVVLGTCFGLTDGIVVDTHVGRLALRLGFSREKNAEKVETDLMRLVKREDWTVFSHLLIWHGRHRCHARKPDCQNCEVLQLCPRIGINIRIAE